MDFEQSEHNTLRGSPKERRVKISFDQGKHSTKPWKGSKSYGYRYDMLLENAKETEMVICNFEGCRTIFAKTGCGGLRHHLKTHEVAVAISQAAVDEALLKFAVCSGQPMSIVGNTHFISFLQAFGNFWVESKEAGHLKQAKDVLPSANTLSSRLDTALESVKEGIMREFSWTNSDVIGWLQGLKDKLVSLTEVMQFFKDEFNVTKGKRAIYNHMPETASEEVFIDKDEVLSLHSKYGNELKAIKKGDKFRVYTMKIRGIYECIDCKHFSQDERPVLLPLLFEKRGRYKLNKGVHHSICFLWTKNECDYEEAEMSAAEDAFTTKDDTANAKHDQSILPDTFKFLSAASNFLATAEKKEQKISAKKKFKAVKRWVAL
uniref:C2H2-type domain-containing protein n=1 Tax=Ditylenchus dipsaci TaxID=166011 RepID=A0A915CS31_9BILA